jgi:uncharacterized membrane protein YcaP (DUF421 family)
VNLLISVLPAFVNTTVIYLLLIIGIRTLGRRQAGQLSALDLLVILLLGSAVETALIGPKPPTDPKPTGELFHDPNTSLLAGIVSAGTLLLVNFVLGHLLRRSRRLRRLISGGTLILVHNGQVVQENLHRAGLSEADLAHTLRSRGCASPSEARFAIMEPNGEVHVLLPEDDVEEDSPGDAMPPSRQTAPKDATV